MVAGGYVAIAAAYVLLGSHLAHSVASSVDELGQIERFKGGAFVAVTGLGLYVVAYLVLRRFAAVASEAARSREALLLSERSALAGLFVSSISHDANNIALVVTSTLAAIKENSLDGMTREALSNAQSAMAALVTLFRDLKEMGRPGSFEKRVQTDLRELVERNVFLLRGHSAMKHCQVRIEAPEVLSLPLVPSLVDQVLINLLMNAADATDGSGVIEVKIGSQGGEARIEVHDNGNGVAPEVEARLFSPFATTKLHGTGLGLVSVKECARAHGGRVGYARSHLGGANFSVCFPLFAKQ